MKCPDCKRARCVWLELKADASKVSTPELERVTSHNVAWIDMTYNGHNGSAYAEERAYARLEPYYDELEKRKKSMSKKITLPEHEETKRVTLDVELKLLERAKAAAKKKKLKFREAVEFGLQKFIEECEK